jgi:hypothetical protein
MATAWAAAQHEPDRLQHRSETKGAVGIPFSENRRLFNECPTWTVPPKAAKAAYVQINDRLATSDGQVTETASVATVNCVGVVAAIRTAHLLKAAPHQQVNDLAAQRHLLEHEPGARR